MRGSRRSLALLAAIVLLGGALRWYVGAAVQPVEPRGDEVYYTAVARAIARGEGHRYPAPPFALAKRPPAHPWLLAQFVEPGPRRRGNDAAPELLPVQYALGALLVLVTGLLGWQLFGARVALVAAAFVAVNPTLIAFSHYFWSEPLFAVLLTLAFAGVLRLPDRPGFAWAALCGLAFGCAALTREIAIPAVGIAAAWSWRAAPPERRRRAAAQGLVLVLAAAAVVLPWTWRNYRVLGGFVPVSTIGWFAAAEGNTLDSEHWFTGNSADVDVFRGGLREAGDELAGIGYARRWAVERIRAEQPAWFFEKLARSTTMLLTPDSPLLMKLREGRYGDVSRARVRGVLVLSVLVYALTLLSAAAGFLSGVSRGRRLLLGGVLLAALATHVFANATARFRVPWLPLAAVFAAVTWTQPRATLRALSAPARWGLIAFAVYFLGVCVPYARPELTAVWDGPAAVRPSAAPVDADSRVEEPAARPRPGRARPER